MIRFIVHCIKSYTRQLTYWCIFSTILVLSYMFYVLYYTDAAAQGFYGTIAPNAKHMISVLGGIPLLFTMFCMCFLGGSAFSVDQRERIQEVMFSQSMSNLKVVLGKTVGLATVSIFPLVVFIVSLQTFAVLHSIGTDAVLHGFKWLPAIKFLLVTCTLSVGLFAALCVAFSVLFRYHLISLAALIFAFLMISMLLTDVSANGFAFFEGLPLIASIDSSYVASPLTLIDFLRYFGYLLICIFLVSCAGLMVTRRDSQRSSAWTTLAVSGVFAVGCFSVIASQEAVRRDHLALWKETVSEFAELAEKQVDVLQITANVEMNPGTELSVSTTLDLQVLDPKADHFVIVLNPGFTLDRVEIDNQEVETTFDDAGVLRITPKVGIPADGTLSVDIHYRGRPNLEFGYSDTALDVANIPNWDQLFRYMGTDNGIFHSQFVALPDEVGWLPRSGLAFNRSHKDFFDSDVSLALPDEWLAVLPGPRAQQHPDTGNANRFTTSTPVSTIDLFAGPFHAVDTTVGDHKFELLTLEGQLERMGFLDNTLELWMTTLEEALDSTREDRFEFPCQEFRLVSVPHPFRLYGGGAFMNSATSGECFVLIREHGLTTIGEGGYAPYLDSVQWTEEMLRAIMKQWVESYWSSNLVGDNIYLDFYSSYWENNVGFRGEEGEALSFLIENLNNLVWFRSMDAFSPSAFIPSAMGFHGNEVTGRRYSQTIQFGMFPGRFSLLSYYFKPHFRHLDTIDTVVPQYVFGSEEIQQVAVDNSIETLLQSDHDPIKLEALRLKCMNISHKLFHFLGVEDTKRLLRELVEAYRYQNLSLEDFYNTADSLDLAVRQILGNWYSSVDTPSLVFSLAKSSPRQDKEMEGAYYQTVFEVSNLGEATAVFKPSVLGAFDTSIYGEALVANSPTLSSPDYVSNYDGSTITVLPGESLQVGIVSKTEPFRVALRNFNLAVGGGHSSIETVLVEADDSSVPEEKFEGSQPSDWQPPNNHVGNIIIDDLDSNFSVNNGTELEALATWRRVNYSTAWGGRKRTFAFTNHHRQKNLAFETELPSSGTWRLDYHVPDFRGRWNDYTFYNLPRGAVTYSATSLFWESIAGEYVVTFESEDRNREYSLEITPTDRGWMEIGLLDLDAGSTNVIVKPQAQDENLFGDAIRWTKIN